MALNHSELRIDKPTVFSFTECLWYLNRNYDDCMHKIDDAKIIKLLQLEGFCVLIQLSECKDYLLAESLQPQQLTAEQWQEVQNYIYEWLDLDRDIQPFYELLAQDADFSILSKHYHGLRLVGIPDLFECLCWSIIGQQINLSFAYKLKRRLVEACGDRQEWNGQNYYAFPKPQQLINLSVDDLKHFQFSGSKAIYLLEVSRQFLEEGLSKQMLIQMEPQERFQRLVSIKGVGEWTANYTLMKCLHQLNSVPYGDAGLQNAWKQLKGLASKPTKFDLITGMKPYQSWEAYLVFYLWRSLSESLSQTRGKSTAQA